jgi:type II secretory pathway component GspD/PulD (secretin)
VALLDPDATKPDEKPLQTEEAESVKPIESRRVSFNFKFAPWEQVLKRFSEIAGLTLEMDDVPKGTFSYYDDATYSPAEALDILNGYLLQKGFILIRRDRFLVVWNYDAYPIPPNLVPTIPLSELPKRGKNELLTVMLPLTNIDIKAAADSVNEMIGPQGKVVSLDKVQRLMVTDIGSNLRRIHEVLEGLGAVDRPDDKVFKQFKLKNISATEADRTVRELFGISANSLRGSSSRSSSSSSSSGYSGYRGDYRGSSDYRGGDPRSGDYRGGDPRDAYRGPEGSRYPTPPTASTQQRIQLAVDGRTNSLLVTATVQDMALVEQTITTIDVAQGTARGAGQNSNESQLKVYALESVDPRVVVDTLNAVIPGLTIIEDTRADHVHVYAPPFEQEMVARMIKEMDQPEMENGVLVVQLRRQDPVATAATLKGLFSGERRDSAPSIEADAVGRRLLIRGTPDQIAQIQRLLEGLGEGVGADSLASGSDQRGTFRMLSPGSHSSEELVTLIERLWGGESARRNPIRIVVPSDLTNPTVRKRSLSAPPELAPEILPPRNPESGSRSGGAPRTESSRQPSPPAARPVKTGAPSAQSVPPRRPIVERDRQIALHSIADTEFVNEEIDDEETAIEPAAKTPIEVAFENDSVPPVADKPAPVVSVGAETTRELPEIRISTFGGRIVVSSDDTRALDEIEHLVETLTQQGSSRSRWTLFYLRSADATETATMLGHLFPAGSVSQTADSGSGFLGSFGSSFSSFGNSVMSATGLNSLGRTQPLRIIPDIRANALFVTGSEDQIEEITDVLRILDSSELPENLRDRVPRMIPVEYADVEEVAEIVRDVYKEQIEGANPMGQGGSRGSSRDGGRDSGFNPLAMLMGGAAGGRGQQRVQMSIGVDTRTNTLVVSANDSLFRQVETLVESLDQSAYEAKRTVRVVELSNATVVTQALSSLLGKVKVSTTGSSSRSSGSSSGGPPPFGGFGGSPFGSSGGSSDDFRRMMEFRSRMMGGGSGFSPFGSRGDSDRGRGDSDRGDSDRGRGDFGRGFGGGDFGRGGFGGPSRGDRGR